MAWVTAVAAVYFAFGASLYMGTMWTLRLFLFPTWKALDSGNVDVHFGTPTRLATVFFTWVVPPMFLAAIWLIIAEWGTGFVWFGVGCVAGIFVLTFVGQRLIIPINKRIRSGEVTDVAELRGLLVRWMTLNDVRFYGATATWLVIVGYLVVRGQLIEVLS